MQFVHSYGVIPLAIGVVIATALNDLVKSVVDGLVTPLIGLISPNTSLQNFQITFLHSTFKIGQVASSAISFMIVCLVVYLVVRYVLKSEKTLSKDDLSNIL